MVFSDERRHGIILHWATVQLSCACDAWLCVQPSYLHENIAMFSHRKNLVSFKLIALLSTGFMNLMIASNNESW